MEKHQILSIVHKAIIEVSPYAAELLAKRGEHRNQDIFLVELGINSIYYAQIAHIVMNELNVDCPLDIFTCSNRIKDVVDIFYHLQGEQTESWQENYFAYAH